MTTAIFRESDVILSKKRIRNGLLLLLILAIAGCSAQEIDTPGGAAAEPSLKVVKTAPVGTIEWERRSELAAEVVPFLELNVVVKADGDVVRVLKKRGDAVLKDEAILEIDKTDILRDKEKADAGFAAAQEQLDKAQKDLADAKKEIALGISKTELSISELERDYAKLRNDYDQGLVDKNRLVIMETRLKQARLDLELLHDKQRTLETSNPLSQAQYQLRAAELALEDVERALSYHLVQAPVSGILTYMPAEEGMALQRGITIGKVQQQNPVKIKAQLTDAVRLQVQERTELTFAYPATGQTFGGKVIYLSATADQQTKTYELELQADNDQGLLKPGSRVQLLIEDRADTASLAVPAAAVMSDVEGPFVYVANGDRAEKRQVAVGKAKEDWIEITQGLSGHEEVVVSGQHRLTDGEAFSRQN